jgi:hypothetical protein
MIKEMAIPSRLKPEPILVAVVRSWTGNHTADTRGGAPIAIGPANPFRAWPIFTVLE